jgi:hypothetical protein
VRPLRYVPYDDASEPNVVVDGSPNIATVLTLSHWPGLPAPEDVWADSSAEMVLRYLDSGDPRHGDAEVVTNNHFDQDGLCGVFALVEPAVALERRAQLTDLARAGDFATYVDRRAARASMALSALTDPERSPLGRSAFSDDYQVTCGALYSEALGMLVELLDHPERFRSLWKDEDDELSAAESAVAAGRIDVREIADIDFAVVRLDATAPTGGGHRFGGEHADGLHPMALHAATQCVRVLLAYEGRYSYTDRYETWVQYRSRSLPRRIDLRPLADELSTLEQDRTAWTATAPGSLTPVLHTAADTESSLALDDVVAVVERALRTAPPAWDPYAT